MAETQRNEENPKAKVIPYSKENINLDARQNQLEGIKKEGGYDKKTPEGKLALSTKWIQRAGLSPAQVDKVWTSIGVADPKNKDEVTQKVAEWQQKNNLVGKDGKGDGILGWATLEALDTVIENEDKKYDTENKNTKGQEEGYGLARSGYHEKKNTENQIKERENANIHGGTIMNGPIGNDGKGNLVFGSEKSDDNTLKLESNMFGSVSIPTSGPKPVDNPSFLSNNTAAKAPERAPVEDSMKLDYQKITEIRAKWGKTQETQSKLIPFYKDSPDRFILDSVTDELPIFENAENRTKEDMTALIRGLQIKVPKGTYYQKTSDGWIKYQGEQRFQRKNGNFERPQTLQEELAALESKNKGVS